jgi:hypothetical protein
MVSDGGKKYFTYPNIILYDIMLLWRNYHSSDDCYLLNQTNYVLLLLHEINHVTINSLGKICFF